jgi:hypothetical protein
VLGAAAVGLRSRMGLAAAGPVAAAELAGRHRAAAAAAAPHRRHPPPPHLACRAGTAVHRGSCPALCLHSRRRTAATCHRRAATRDAPLLLKGGAPPLLDDAAPHNTGDETLLFVFEAPPPFGDAAPHTDDETLLLVFEALPPFGDAAPRVSINVLALGYVEAMLVSDDYFDADFDGAQPLLSRQALRRAQALPRLAPRVAHAAILQGWREPRRGLGPRRRARAQTPCSGCGRRGAAAAQPPSAARAPDATAAKESRAALEPYRARVQTPSCSSVALGSVRALAAWLDTATVARGAVLDAVVGAPAA